MPYTTRSTAISERTEEKREEDVTSMRMSMDDITDLIQKVTESCLQKFSSNMESKMDAMFSKFDKKFECLQEMVSNNMRKLSAAEKKIDQLEQYSRKNNLRLFGIPEANSENTDNLIVNLCKEKLGIDINKEDIDRSHRVGSDNKTTRAILVKFVSYRVKNDVYRKKKLLKGSKIVIKEDITKHRMELYQKAVDKYGQRMVWTSDGKIVVLFENRKYYIQEEQDLLSIGSTQKS